MISIIDVANCNRNLFLLALFSPLRRYGFHNNTAVSRCESAALCGSSTESDVVVAAALNVEPLLLSLVCCAVRPWRASPLSLPAASLCRHRHQPSKNETSDHRPTFPTLSRTKRTVLAYTRGEFIIVRACSVEISAAHHSVSKYLLVPVDGDIVEGLVCQNGVKIVQVPPGLLPHHNMDYKSVVYNAARDGNLNRLKVRDLFASLGRSRRITDQVSIAAAFLFFDATKVA